MVNVVLSYFIYLFLYKFFFLFFQMLAVLVWTLEFIFSFLNVHNAVAQSQMCSEPFQAVITLVTNVTFPTLIGQLVGF